MPCTKIGSCEKNDKEENRSITQTPVVKEEKECDPVYLPIMYAGGKPLFPLIIGDGPPAAIAFAKTGWFQP